MKQVVISQYRLLHYRQDLFDRLREACSGRGFELRVLHGQPTRRELPKQDTGQLPWADVVENRYVEVGGRDWLWQPTPKHLSQADMIILMQENRLLSNYPKLFGLAHRRARIAYWGHGRNFQSRSPDGIRERWKRATINMVDWWFAYTELTRDILVSSGYDSQRISVLDNAIDNQSFKRDLEHVDGTREGRVRDELDLSSSGTLGLFCGSLYPDKRLDFLIDACDIIHGQRSDFRLVVIGDGPSGDFIRAAAATRPWMKAVGVKRGVDKASYFKVANVVLNPGLVGLHVLDAFCAGLPMVTTCDALHSPEISYLRHGDNGLICGGNASQYAADVLHLLGDGPRLQAMRAVALGESFRYTLENMVNSFVDGIERCLSMPKKNGRFR